jgi:hypothetical protein
MSPPCFLTSLQVLVVEGDRILVCVALSADHPRECGAIFARAMIVLTVFDSQIEHAAPASWG